MQRQQGDAGGIEPLLVTGMDVDDVTLAVGDECRPVECEWRLRQGEAELPRQRDFLGEVGRQPHRFLRHAADIDAGATERTGGEQRHAGAIGRGAECRGQAAGTGAEHDKVEVSLFGVDLFGAAGAHAKRSTR